MSQKSILITSNWKGSITGWKLTPEQSMTNIPRRLLGLADYWIVGHRVFSGGGLPAAISTACEVLWKQCKKDKKAFATKGIDVHESVSAKMPA